MLDDQYDKALDNDPNFLIYCHRQMERSNELATSAFLDQKADAFVGQKAPVRGSSHALSGAVDGMKYTPAAGTPNAGDETFEDEESSDSGLWIHHQKKSHIRPVATPVKDNIITERYGHGVQENVSLEETASFGQQQRATDTGEAVTERDASHEESSGANSLSHRWEDLHVLLSDRSESDEIVGDPEKPQRRVRFSKTPVQSYECLASGHGPQDCTTDGPCIHETSKHIANANITRLKKALMASEAASTDLKQFKEALLKAADAEIEVLLDELSTLEQRIERPQGGLQPDATQPVLQSQENSHAGITKPWDEQMAVTEDYKKMQDSKKDDALGRLPVNEKFSEDQSQVWKILKTINETVLTLQNCKEGEQVQQSQVTDTVRAEIKYLKDGLKSANDEIKVLQNIIVHNDLKQSQVRKMTGEEIDGLKHSIQLAHTTIARMLHGRQDSDHRRLLVALFNQLGTDTQGERGAEMKQQVQAEVSARLSAELKEQINAVVQEELNAQINQMQKRMTTDGNTGQGDVLIEMWKGHFQKLGRQVSLEDPASVEATHAAALTEVQGSDQMIAEPPRPRQSCAALDSHPDEKPILVEQEPTDQMENEDLYSYPTTLETSGTQQVCAALENHPDEQQALGKPPEPHADACRDPGPSQENEKVLDNAYHVVQGWVLKEVSKIDHNRPLRRTRKSSSLRMICFGTGVDMERMQRIPATREGCRQLMT
ncbi:hypothetical protein BKA63DRAFT_497440 [Paraphoma chrysanthemicola]|nr:hypothetical protein BKA63DRAFT_497440 [Paraphoma chrysanthemicola]